MTDIRFCVILHKSSAAFTGTAHPRFKQISNMARRILDKHTTSQKTEIHTALLNAHTVWQTAAQRPYRRQERNLNRPWLESKGKVQTMKVTPSSFDDDRMGRQVDTPCQCGSANNNLNGIIGKKILHDTSILPHHTCMMDGEAELQ